MTKSECLLLVLAICDCKSTVAIFAYFFRTAMSMKLPFSLLVDDFDRGHLAPRITQ